MSISVQSCYPILLHPLTIMSLYSYGQREYPVVVCDAFILDKGKAENICYSTALVGSDNSMYKRYRVLVRANNKNKSATQSVYKILKRGTVSVTDKYYIKHVKYPGFEGDIIELNYCGVWEWFSGLDYDVKKKKESRNILIQAEKTSQEYYIDKIENHLNEINSEK